MTCSIIHTALTSRRPVILDWDGTLADTQERNYRALCAGLASHHVVIDRDWYRHHVGLAIRDLLALVTAEVPLPIEQIITTSSAHLLASTTSNTLTAIPAVVDLVWQARAAGLPCAVASGAATELVQAGLDALDMHELFQTVVTREDVAHGKPAPDTFLEAARRLGVAPEHCIAVEDSVDGVTAARQAGMRVLLVRDGQLTWPADTVTPTRTAPDPLT